MEYNSKTTTKKETVIRLNNDQLVKLVTSKEFVKISEFGKVSITIDIPGGGDWSNMSVGVDDVSIKLKIVEEFVEENSYE